MSSSVTVVSNGSMDRMKVEVDVYCSNQNAAEFIQTYSIVKRIPKKSRIRPIDKVSIKIERPRLEHPCSTTGPAAPLRHDN